MKRRIRRELLDGLLAGYKDPEDLTGPDGLLKQLAGALVERALSAELTDHLGQDADESAGNTRNGTSPKTLITDQGEVPIDVPRDRQGTFEPKLVKKHQRRFTGFDDKILSMDARGMSVRDIQAHLSEIYGTEISPTLIWPIVYLDAIVLKVREQGVVQNKHVYLAMGISLEGKKEVLGLWMEPNEGAKFWLKVITEFKNRGIEDIFVVCCDGLNRVVDFSLRKVTRARAAVTSRTKRLRSSCCTWRSVTWRRTLLDECFRVAGRTTWYTEPGEIQRDLDRFLDFYNRERSHQGYRLKRRTPAQGLCEALEIPMLPPLVTQEWEELEEVVALDDGEPDDDAA